MGLPGKQCTMIRMYLGTRRIMMFVLQLCLKTYFTRDDCLVAAPTDVFNKIHYKTLSWELVAVLMIAEIVSNGMLSLPSSLAVVGLVPGIILIVFLGSFGLFTSWILIQFKLRHPEGEGHFLVHRMHRRRKAWLGMLACLFAIDSSNANALLSPQHGRCRHDPVRAHRPGGPFLWHDRLCSIRNWWSITCRPNSPRRPLRQKALPYVIHRHLRHPHAHLCLAAHS